LYFCKNSNLLPIGHSFIELASVDSTNNYAMARAHAGMASHGTLFFAYDQWAGKGQRGKSWTSQPGDNIVLSALLIPGSLPIIEQFSLSTAVALACHDFFSRYAGPETTKIKWPNDLYWRDRKAGGILIENSFKGDHWAFAIAGMGININQVQFPDTARNPVSLRQISGQSYDAVELARELGRCLDDRYEQWQAGQTADLLSAYNARLYKRGEAVRLKKDNAVFTTVVQDVRASGKLVTRDTLEREFSFGEVEWVI
jgi:BirA family transcriptional regulator, biotin operon repressor / biotin---[acetyl-CoA-carboxylase] ligase